MNRISLYMMLGAAAVGSHSGALAQQSPTPTPTPTPPPTPPSTYEMRHPNASTFEREYDSRIRLGMTHNQQTEYAVARSVAQCVAKRAKGGAGNLLGGTMTSDLAYEELTTAMTRRYRSCVVETAVGLPMSILNGALAEELVHQRSPRLPDRAVPADVNAAKAFYTDKGGLTIDTVGRCVAVYSPGLAYRVLGTPAGSQAEAQAMDALYAMTPECGVRARPKDIPAAEQRSAVAAGLYHWTNRG